MNKKLCIVLVLIASLILGLLAPVFTHPAYAQEEMVHKTIYCQGRCEILGEILDKLIAKASPIGIYATLGDNNYKLSESWETAENPAGWWPGSSKGTIPQEVVIPLYSFVSIPEMGVYMHYDQLYYHEPGYLLRGEVATALPSNKSTSKVGVTEIEKPNWDDPELWGSYSWNGKTMLVWYFVPEIVKDNLVLHIFSVHIYKYTQARVPATDTVTYDPVHAMWWVPGEKLEVIQKFYRASYVPTVYEHSWEDIVWMYENEINFLSGFMPKEAAIGYIQIKWAEEIKSLLVEENYEDTDWRTTFVSVVGYRMRRANGAEFNLAADMLSFTKQCGDYECTGGNASVGDLMYVEGSTLSLWSPTDNPKWFNLHTSSVNPLQKIHPDDKALLDKRYWDGEVIEVKGRITLPYDMDWDGDGRVDNTLIGFKAEEGQNYDLPYIDLSASWTPPAGTWVVVYIYKDNAQAPNLDLSWDVMALTDYYNSNHVWFFNEEAEYGYQFSPLRYSIGTCGGLMTLDNWLEGCSK